MSTTFHASDDLSEILRTAAESGAPIRVRVNDVTYVLRVSEEPRDTWAGYDPASVRNALRKYGGSWSDLDADELISAMYRARDEGSRPMDSDDPQ